MYEPDFVIKEGDTLPRLEATLSDGNGAVDLTGASVRFFMTRTVGVVPPKVDAAAVVTGGQEGEDRGKVSYTWVTADTNTPGRYLAEFQVTFPSGDVESFPNSEHLLIEVVRDLE